MENNPQVVFERLFGDGSTAEQRAARRERGAQPARFGAGRSRLAAEDAAGERSHAPRSLPHDVREIERRIALAGAADAAAGSKLPTAPTGIPDDFDAHIKLMFDLQVLAWQADITRVTTLMFAKEVSNAIYPASGIRDPFHNLSHHSNVPDNIARLAQLNQYHVKTFAYLLEKLRDTPDGDGTLLDHSLLLYGSGMSNSNQHDHAPLPIVLAGGAAGKLKGGRHIQVAPKTPLSNLLLAMLHKLGVPAESFGDSTGRRSM